MAWTDPERGESMDIQYEWEILLHRKPNAGEFLAFTTHLVKEYWKICDEPKDREALDKYRSDFLKSPSYAAAISCSMEFILEHTGIQLKYPDWAL